MEPFVLPTLNSGIDQLGIVGTVAPGSLAQPGRCWRFVYEKPSDQVGPLFGPRHYVPSHENTLLRTRGGLRSGSASSSFHHVGYGEAKQGLRARVHR